MLKSLLAATAAIATAAPAATPQRPALDRPMLPYALQYAACAHAGRSDCAALRAELTARSEPVFRHYYQSHLLQARPRFQRLLDGIDQGAADLRRANAAPSAGLVAYLQCLGDAYVADRRFEQGVAVDRIEALEACEDARKAVPVANLTTAEEKRSRSYLFNVERLLGASSGVLIRNGLLGLPTYPNFG